MKLVHDCANSIVGDDWYCPQNKDQNSETLNGPFLFGDKGTPAEYRAGLELAIARGGWNCMTREPT
jgi:hypothetical protein